MALVAEGATHPLGEALAQELRWIHGIIRSHLKTIEQVIDQIETGAPAAQVRAQLGKLATSNIIWTLRINCMRYCTLVHGHHHHEDVAFFPELRAANPALETVIDKLMADHVVVSQYLDQVEAAANRLIEDEAAGRRELVTALSGLGEHLLTHLDYEEANLTPTLRRLTAWPPA